MSDRPRFITPPIFGMYLDLSIGQSADLTSNRGIICKRSNCTNAFKQTIQRLYYSTRIGSNHPNANNTVTVEDVDAPCSSSATMQSMSSTGPAPPRATVPVAHTTTSVPPMNVRDSNLEAHAGKTDRSKHNALACVTVYCRSIRPAYWQRSRTRCKFHEEWDTIGHRDERRK